MDGGGKNQGNRLTHGFTLSYFTARTDGSHTPQRLLEGCIDMEAAVAIGEMLQIPQKKKKIRNSTQQTHSFFTIRCIIIFDVYMCNDLTTAYPYIYIHAACTQEQQCVVPNNKNYLIIKQATPATCQNEIRAQIHMGKLRTASPVTISCRSDAQMGISAK